MLLLLIVRNEWQKRTIYLFFYSLYFSPNLQSYKVLGHLEGFNQRYLSFHEILFHFMKLETNREKRENTSGETWRSQYFILFTHGFTVNRESLTVIRDYKQNKMNIIVSSFSNNIMWSHIRNHGKYILLHCFQTGGERLSWFVIMIYWREVFWNTLHVWFIWKGYEMIWKDMKQKMYNMLFRWGILLFF